MNEEHKNFLSQHSTMQQRKGGKHIFDSDQLGDKQGHLPKCIQFAEQHSTQGQPQL
jgi:hypothetical protein